jgi:ABC-type lipoprotein release transport system permease subunit
MGYALTNVFGGAVQFKIPWGTITLYGVITLFSAIFAAILPAIRASSIPASDALRYTG